MKLPSKKGTTLAMAAKLKNASGAVHRTAKPTGTPMPKATPLSKTMPRAPVVRSESGPRAVAGRPGVAKGVSITAKAPTIKAYKKTAFQK